MQILRTLLLLLLSVSIFSCEEIEEVKANFDMDIDSSFTVAASTRVDQPIEISPEKVKTNTKFALELNNSRKGLMSEVRLIIAELELVQPASGDLSFLETVNIYISADNMPEIWYAGLDEIPAELGAQLTLVCTTEDIRKYIRKDRIFLRTEVTTDEGINQNHRINLHTKVLIDAIEDLN